MSGGSSVFYVYDQQGGTAERLDSTGTVLASSMNDAYGAIASTSPANMIAALRVAASRTPLDRVGVTG